MLTSGALMSGSAKSLRLLGPALTMKEMNVICWGLFISFLLLPVSLLLERRVQTGAALQGAEVDFTYFYGLGRILNEYPADRLYDYDLQKRILTEIHPLSSGTYGPNPYHPIIAVLFGPFARLPFLTAYLLWGSISFIFYIVGLAILMSHYFPGDRLRQSLTFCLALSFYPFLWTMANGQISTIAFVSLALVFRQEDLDRPLQSGLALSICLYKPVLLVLVLPMLLLTRRFKTLVGFAAGAAAIALFTTIKAGVLVWSGYLSFLLSFGRRVASRQLWQYVDLASFSFSLFGRHSAWGLTLLLGLAGLLAFILFRTWRQSIGAPKPATALVWGMTLTWTLVLNVYIPVHDCILGVLGVIATAAVLSRAQRGYLHRWFALLCFLTFALFWITVHVAETTGFQMITVCLAALGTLQIGILRKIIRPT
jgi:Glycosyltransferase family 87